MLVNSITCLTKFDSLEELQDMKSSLTALNKSSAELFSKTAADYVRAARLAGQVKSDLNDITKRITCVGP